MMTGIQEMPEVEISNFLADIKAVGVFVEGEKKLFEILTRDSDWQRKVCSLACEGRKDGIRFLRTNSSTDDFVFNMIDILDRYVFDTEQRRLFTNNVMPDERLKISSVSDTEEGVPNFV